MAFMSYNPSIGRVMEKGSVNKFEQIAVEIIKILENFTGNIIDFDELHHSWIINFQNNIKTNKGDIPSYGQAQKAINVYLKLYVYWAKLIRNKNSNNLISYLHVPLDKLLMKGIKKYYRDFYTAQIKPFKNPHFSLSKIDKDQYYKWQNFFREKYPERPILFDTIWAIERKNLLELIS